MMISRDDLQALLEQGLSRHQVPGASVAVFHEGVLTTAAAGIANVSTGVEVTPQTVMHIGSITKVLNATLIMQLVDEGKVDLEERVVRYLPGLRLKDREALKRITVMMLLNHTSGIDGDMLPDHGHDEETIEKGIERFAGLGQIFSPGAECSYCNPATVIAGYLAQRLTGESWYRLMHERIFRPLGMEHAAALPEEALLHRASVGHYLRPNAGQGPTRTSFAFLPLSFAPAGTTLMMSAGDLVAFARAHMSDGCGANGARILSADSATLMRQMRVLNKGKGYTYSDGVGIGWLVFENGMLNHPGGGPGIVSVLYVYPERGFAAAILTNAEHGLTLIHEIMGPWLDEFGGLKLFGKAAVQVPREPPTIDHGKYVGLYEDIITRHTVSQSGTGLTLSSQAKFAPYESISTAPTPAARLLPLGDDQFTLGAAEGGTVDTTDAFRIVTFRNRNGQGQYQHLGNSLRLYPRVR